MLMTGSSVSIQTDVRDKAALGQKQEDFQSHGFDLDLSSILISAKDSSVLLEELRNRLCLPRLLDTVH